MYDYYNFNFVPPAVQAQAQREADAAKAEAAKTQPVAKAVEPQPTSFLSSAQAFFAKHWPHGSTALPAPTTQPGVSTGAAR